VAELDNVKHENFVQNIFSGMSQRAAYRAAFPSSAKWKDKTVDNRAYELYNSGEILGRLKELQELSTSAAVLTVTERKEMLSEIARDKQEKTKDRISAVDLLNKMDGAYTENVNVSGQINNPFSGLSTEELKKLIDDE
jgi:dihydropteroate synthase